jgi:hypothetical protein
VLLSLGEGTKGSHRLQGERMLPQVIHVETWNTAKIMGPRERWRSPGSLTGSHPLQIDMLARTRLHEIVFRSSLLPSVCISAVVATAYHLECDSEGGRGWANGGLFGFLIQVPHTGITTASQYSQEIRSVQSHTELTFPSIRRSGPMRSGRDNFLPRPIPHGCNLPQCPQCPNCKSYSCLRRLA